MMDLHYPAIGRQRGLKVKTQGLLPPFSRFARLASDHVVRAYYTGPFWHYDCLREASATWDILPLIRSLPSTARDILEIGSGNGRITFRLEDIGRRVTALDSSPETLEALQSKITPSMNIQPMLADVLNCDVIGHYDTIIIASLSINLFDDLSIRRLIDFIGSNKASRAYFCFGVLDDSAISSFEVYTGHNDSSLFLEPYRDQEGVERIMTSCIFYDKAKRLLNQNWLVDMVGSRLHEPRYQIAITTERMWTFSEIDGVLRLHGYVLEHDEPVLISGGGAADQKVHMVRYRVPEES